jgi:hypothetical protein
MQDTINMKMSYTYLQSRNYTDPESLLSFRLARKLRLVFRGFPILISNL